MGHGGVEFNLLSFTDYMMAGRFFAGAGIGWLSFLAPLYQVSRRDRRRPVGFGGLSQEFVSENVRSQRPETSTTGPSAALACWRLFADVSPASLVQSEIAQPSIRGAMTVIQQFALGIGALVASWGECSDPP
jgi:hypothetical protein